MKRKIIVLAALGMLLSVGRMLGDEASIRVKNMDIQKRPVKVSLICKVKTRGYVSKLSLAIESKEIAFNEAEKFEYHNNNPYVLFWSLGHSQCYSVVIEGKGLGEIQIGGDRFWDLKTGEQYKGEVEYAGSSAEGDCKAALHEKLDKIRWRR